MADIFCFSRFEADRDRHQLRQGNRRIKLERIPLELLFLLLERDGKLVTREEIVARIWGTDLLLDAERSINTAIRKIRKALRDDPHNPKFIETVVCRGYRFVAPLIRDEQAVELRVPALVRLEGPGSDPNQIWLRGFAIESNGEGPILTCNVVVGDMSLGRLPLVKLGLPPDVTLPLRHTDTLLLKLHGLELSLTQKAAQALNAFSISVLESSRQAPVTESSAQSDGAQVQ